MPLSKNRASELSNLYRTTLLDDVIPFWERHSLDGEAGGYFTCLRRDGSVFDTDKFVWLQARQVWMFSKLYNAVERKNSWLEMARLGAEFLRDHAIDPEGNWYFSLDRYGNPLIVPYSIFSDCFGAMAMGEYASASGEEWARDLAVRTYKNIRKRWDNPKGPYEKRIAGARPLITHALPMIDMNLSMELEPHLQDPNCEERISDCLDSVFNLFVDPKTKIVFENVAPDGSHVDCFEGRLIEPGHGCESMGFAIEASLRLGRKELIEEASEVLVANLELGWDKEHGGLFAFLDSHGHPPEKLEWDQKLWWAQLEAMVSCALAYRHTGNADCARWYERLHDYAWSHFSDPEFGEWFGYLNRDGEVLLDLKGGKWKGCFHVPRSMLNLWRIFA